MTGTELPDGYRWATASETERWSANPERVPDAIWVRRTLDSQGRAYRHGETDMAVPDHSA